MIDRRDAPRFVGFAVTPFSISACMIGVGRTARHTDGPVRARRSTHARASTLYVARRNNRVD
ncbi:hypothetical protein C7S16_3293 [Burkholderia thailandensis]|uniref:Lipoprotein n=1 Tax=Burkholderia thailandensis TaxID=57975 RepID=A0AAW9D0T3_BURTH|nr:hypothetical protein [Burkholderia thailandensis]MDW9255526.1 hypothetical protein [Burkholderia thailandensis]